MTFDFESPRTTGQITYPAPKEDPFWTAATFLLYTLSVIVLLSAPALVVVAWRWAL